MQSLRAKSVNLEGVRMIRNDRPFASVSFKSVNDIVSIRDWLLDHNDISYEMYGLVNTSGHCDGAMFIFNDVDDLQMFVFACNNGALIEYSEEVTHS